MKPAAAVPGAGAAIGAAWSSTVVNSDSVPSRLSMTSIRRLCCGVSACEAVLICQKPLRPRLIRSIRLSCVWPATYATTLGYLQEQRAHAGRAARPAVDR